MKEIEVSTHEFKNGLAHFMHELELGHYDRIVVKRHKKRVGVFTSLLPAQKHGPYGFGFLKDRLKFTPEEWKAWENLDEEIARDFEAAIDDDSA